MKKDYIILDGTWFRATTAFALRAFFAPAILLWRLVKWVCRAIFRGVEWYFDQCDRIARGKK